MFERDIALEGELDDAQRAKLLEIAERCPVHRTLQHGADVTTRLVAPPSSSGDEDAGQHMRDMDEACQAQA